MDKTNLPSHVIDSLKVVASKQGFINPKFEYSKGSDKGFIGLIERCRIIGENKSLPLVCKFLPNNEKQNLQFGSIALFEREVFVYQKFLPEIEKIQLEHGFSYRDEQGFWSHPMCYLSEFHPESPNGSLIIMEDLSEQGFETRDLFVPSDFRHTKRIFDELGKLHAISIALRVKKPEVFNEFKKMEDRMCRLMTTKEMTDLAPRNCQLAADLFNQPDETVIRDKILSYKFNLWQQVGDLLRGTDAEPFGAICHGDCWINNVMYSYQASDSNAIDSIRLIDWQMTRFGVGASELTYYLHCCNDKVLRDQHQNDLIESYYSSLRRVLMRFDMDVLDFYPFSRVKEQLVTFGKFAFAMASFSIPILTKYPTKLFEDQNAELTDEEQVAVASYRKTMKDVVNDLFEMGAL